MKVKWLSLVLLTTLVTACAQLPPPNTPQSAGQDSPATVIPPTAASSSGSWSAGLTVSVVDGAAVHASSSKLSIAWNAPAETVDHYEVTAADSTVSGVVSAVVESSSATTTLTGLKSGTSYTVSLRACLDANCSQALSADATGSGTTEQEYWQIQGSGNSYETATHVVENGSALSYALHYGNEAGALAGQTAFFFNPRGNQNWMGGPRIALNNSTATEIQALSSFSVTSNGLQHPCPRPDQVENCEEEIRYVINASQPIPLANENKVRLFFEASNLTQQNNAPTRVYYLDSQDGLIGQDYDKGADTVCESADYMPGGGCAFTLAVGLTGDAGVADSGLSQSRQFKIGYPTQNSWMWDGAAGTFMVITGADTCGQTENGLFYGVWDGGQWNVQKNGDCPNVLVQSAHGPVIVHLGGAAYKLYYEDESNGKEQKPLKVIYANGGSDAVDFADWESSASAREVNFLWPDGSLLAANEESGLGDHTIMLPTNSADYQVMYMNLGGFDNPSWNQPSDGLGIAVLINP